MTGSAEVSKWEKAWETRGTSNGSAADFLVQFNCSFSSPPTVLLSVLSRHEVDSGIKDTQQEIQLVTQALAAYESIGMGFDSLVEEYTQLREEVENKKWAVRELKHSLEKE